MGSKYRTDLDQDKIIAHYRQQHVIDAMLKLAPGKEVVGSFGGQGYAKRPNGIQFPNDIIQQVEGGVTSFHISEETWTNPFQLKPGMARKEMDRLRKAWDLIIDIDCAFFEYSKCAAHLVIQALEHAGISSITCKFSGNHGFHIAVPYEAFPKEVNGIAVNTLFPEAPRIIAEYLKHLIEPQGRQGHLSRMIIDYERNAHKLPEDTSEEEVIPFIQDKTGLGFNDLTRSHPTDTGESLQFSAFKILEIDTLLISSRHLVRHVYSVNEKSGLVSIPINPQRVLEFDRDVADITHMIKSRFNFLERHKAKTGEATQLFVQAYDHHRSLQKTEIEKHDKRERIYDEITDKVPEQYFPECIKKISAGMQDGRKRAVFILANFLNSLGWPYKEVEQYIIEWNKRNPDPLRDVYLFGQLRGLKKGQKKILPPNCDNAAYYESMGVKCDNCRSRNPVNHAVRLFRRDHLPKGGREELTEEQKEARRKHRQRLKELKDAKKVKEKHDEQQHDDELVL